MADLKISQLTETTTSAPGDYFIINKGDATTQKISATNMGKSSSYAPFIHNFVANQSLSTTGIAGELEWTLDASGSVTIRYDSNITSDRVFDAVAADPAQLVMPPGANKAIVFWENSVKHGAAGGPELATTSVRSVHTAHRLRIDGATFPFEWTGTTVDKEGFGVLVQTIVELNNNTESVILNRKFHTHFSKYDVIEFSEGATVTFTARMDVLKAGRASVKVGAGRLLVMPYYDDGNSVTPVTFGGDESGPGFYWSDATLGDLYDDVSPEYTPADRARELGRDDREFIRRYISALESRKNNIPSSSSATVADYDSLISQFWAVLDNPTLTTHDVFNAALDPVVTEANDPKYGVSDLFAFETAAGATGRELL